MAEPDIAKTLADLGMNPSTLTPDQFAQVQKNDVKVWAHLVKLSGATAD